VVGGRLAVDHHDVERPVGARRRQSRLPKEARSTPVVGLRGMRRNGGIHIYIPRFPGGEHDRPVRRGGVDLRAQLDEPVLYRR
jgi:hypothetical protein